MSPCVPAPRSSIFPHSDRPVTCSTSRFLHGPWRPVGDGEAPGGLAHLPCPHASSGSLHQAAPSLTEPLPPQGQAEPFVPCSVPHLTNRVLRVATPPPPRETPRMKENVSEVNHLVCEQSWTETEADPREVALGTRVSSHVWTAAGPWIGPFNAHKHRHSRTRPAGPLCCVSLNLYHRTRCGGATWEGVRRGRGPPTCLSRCTRDVVRSSGGPEPHTAVLGLPRACPKSTLLDVKVLEGSGCSGQNGPAGACRALWSASTGVAESERDS